MVHDLQVLRKPVDLAKQPVTSFGSCGAGVTPAGISRFSTASTTIDSGIDTRRDIALPRSSPQASIT